MDEPNLTGITFGSPPNDDLLCDENISTQASLIAPDKTNIEAASLDTTLKDQDSVKGGFDPLTFDERSLTSEAGTIVRKNHTRSNCK